MKPLRKREYTLRESKIGDSVTTLQDREVTGMNELLSRHSEFCQHCQVFSGHTVATVKSMTSVIRLFHRMTGIGNLADLTQESIENWIIKGQLERGWAPKTRRLYLNYLSSFGKWCVSRGLLPQNPVERIPRPKQPKKISSCLSTEECETILAWVRNFPFGYRFERTRAIAIVSMFLATGIRRSELRNLQLIDLDLDRNEVMVRSGKGLKDRRIPFRPSLGNVLRDYLADRRRLKKECPYLFTAMRQDTQMGDKVLSRLFSKLRDKTGIHFYPHLLRHTYATRLLENGLTLLEVKELLGHESIETTAHYLSVTAQRINEQVLAHGIDV